MKTAISAIFGGLLLGGIIHIAIVFMVPYFASNDAWSRVQNMAVEARFHVLPPPLPENETLPRLDPRMAHAICRFDLTKGAVRISALVPSEFWSVAIFDRRGRNIFSLNDGSTDRDRLDLILITPVQMALLRQDAPSSLETAIIVDRALDVGFALLRVLVADDSLVESVGEALAAASCGTTLS